MEKSTWYNIMPLSSDVHPPSLPPTGTISILVSSHGHGRRWGTAVSSKRHMRLPGYQSMHAICQHLNLPHPEKDPFSARKTQTDPNHGSIEYRRTFCLRFWGPYEFGPSIPVKIILPGSCGPEPQLDRTPSNVAPTASQALRYNYCTV